MTKSSGKVWAAKTVKLYNTDNAIKYVSGISEKGKVKNPVKINLDDSILLLLSSIDYNKVVISRTLLMKEVFLLYEEIFKKFGLSSGADKDAGYIAYKYGPYSFMVNTSVITLMLSGKIQLTNYYDIEKKEKERLELDLRKRYLDRYETVVKFEDVASRYKKLLRRANLNISRLKKIIANKKRAWDQDGTQGIIRYVYKEYKEYITNSELKDVYPELFFGVVKEDRVRRYDRNKRSISR